MERGAGSREQGAGSREEQEGSSREQEASEQRGAMSPLPLPLGWSRGRGKGQGQGWYEEQGQAGASRAKGEKQEARSKKQEARSKKQQAAGSKQQAAGSRQCKALYPTRAAATSAGTSMFQISLPAPAAVVIAAATAISSGREPSLRGPGGVRAVLLQMVTPPGSRGLRF